MTSRASPDSGYGTCGACGFPMTDREMFHGDLCDSCRDEYEMPCPAAGGIPCGSEDCLRNGCEDQR